MCCSIAQNYCVCWLYVLVEVVGVVVTSRTTRSSVCAPGMVEVEVVAVLVEVLLGTVGAAAAPFRW